MITINDKQLKGMAKQALDVIKKTDPNKIKYSNILEAFSHALGYKDYNSLSSDIKQAKSTPAGQPITMHEAIIEANREQEEKYPSSVNDNFVLFQKTEHYEFLIHRELSNDDWSYYLLFRLNSSHTKRALYSPRYETFSLFVYPDIESATSDYTIDIRGVVTDKLAAKCFDIVHHVGAKSWADRELMDDMMDLMKWVMENKNRLDAYNNQVDKEKLKEIYLNARPNSNL